MDKIRFGIIGVGTQGTAYAGFLAGRQTHPDFPNPPAPAHAVLGALCGRSQATADHCQALFPGVPFFRDYREMAASGLVDAVIITVPHYQHPAVAAWCLEHGMPVLMDKPAGVYSKAVQRLHRAADAHPGAAYGVMYNHRANSLHQRVHALIASGELGQVRSSYWAVTDFWRPDSYYTLRPERGTWGGEGGGILTNQATHQLDLWQWLCGVPTHVYAQMRFGAYRKVIQVENQATLLTRYANGATGCFITSACNLDGENRLIIDLDKGRILLEDGKKATIHRFIRGESQVNDETGLDALQKIISGKGLGVPLYTEEIWEASEPWGYQHAAMMENFALHLLQGQPLLVPGREALYSVDLTNAALLSAWKNCEVPNPADPDEFLAQLNRHIAQEGLYPPRE